MHIFLCQLKKIRKIPEVLLEKQNLRIPGLTKWLQRWHAHILQNNEGAHFHAQENGLLYHYLCGCCITSGRNIPGMLRKYIGNNKASL